MIGTLTRADRDGALFVDSHSNDMIVSTKTPSQRILFGFASNVHSSVSFSASNIEIGTSDCNVTIAHHGNAVLQGNLEASNVYAVNTVGIGALSFSSNLKLYVAGDARIEGNLIVNGDVQSIDTTVSVTDELQVTNAGTGPALLVNQLGATPIATYQHNSNTVVQVTSSGDVIIGAALNPEGRLDVHGKTYMRDDIFTSNVKASNVNMYSIDGEIAYLNNLYMGNKLIIDASGIITNSNYIPTLDTSKVQYGTFTSNFIENANVTSAKLAQNLTLAGVTFIDGVLGVAASNFIDRDPIKVRTGGNALFAGPSNFESVGDQARLYLGNTSHFIGASCNVGIVMQVPNTVYPFVLEETSGYIGLGVLDPDERLHVANNAKFAQQVYVIQRLAIGHSNPLESLAIQGDFSMSNTASKVTMYTRSNALGIGTSNPQSKMHVVQESSSLLDALRVSPSNALKPFVVKASGMIGVGTESPSEYLDVAGNTKVSSNMYVIGKIAIGSSNPVCSLDVSGNARVRGELYINTKASMYDTGMTDGASNAWSIENTSRNLRFARSNASASVLFTDAGNVTIGGDALGQERLHVVNGNVKVDQHTFLMGSVGISTSNVSETLEIGKGNAKFSSNVYVMSMLAVGTSNPLYTMDVRGTAANFASDVYVLQSLGVGTSNPQYALHVEGGDVSFSSNAYVARAIGVGTTTASETIDVAQGNIKAGSNMYAMRRLGVGTSNPSVTLETNGTDSMLVPRGTTLERPTEVLRGNMRYNTDYDIFEGLGGGNTWWPLGGVRDTNMDTYIIAEPYPAANDDTLRFVANEAEVMKITEAGIEITSGCRVGVGESYPEQALHVAGNVRSSVGTLGPMITLVPPVFFSDITPGNRLLLDHTLEAGNNVADGVSKPLFYGSGFLFYDASEEEMEWTEARLIFRGAPLLSAEQSTSLVVEDFVSSRTPQYSNVINPFSLRSTVRDYGYQTYATPWFSSASGSARHFALKVVSSTENSPFRFGSVYMQFRALQV